MMIAQITDTHIRPHGKIAYGRVDTNAMLEAAVATLEGLPRNPDRRAELFAEFGADGYMKNDDGFLHYTIEGHEMRLIGLDTVVPGYGHGEMCAQRLAWPEGRLAERRDQPTLVFMHHPPFSTGLADMDRINCRNGQAMSGVLRRVDNIERVVCGHHHRPITVRWGGTVGSVAPSTAHQVTLDLIPDNRTTFV